MSRYLVGSEVQKAEGIGREVEQCGCVRCVQGTRDSLPLLMARGRGGAEKGEA